MKIYALCARGMFICTGLSGKAGAWAILGALACFGRIAWACLEGDTIVVPAFRPGYGKDIEHGSCVALEDYSCLPHGLPARMLHS